ncbi:MAG: MATE family efflux transporter [Sellimonas sp.]|uniref:MATE family efflux transporter n=1 Tax=Sellimonas sp. TaxID=2021466 RepID=UPI00399FA680
MKLKMSNEVNLGEEPVRHLLFVLAVPSITSQLVNALYNMVDRMYIGHIPEIGASALTGVGVCFPLIMIISAFAYLLGMGGAPRASILMGLQISCQQTFIAFGNSRISAFLAIFRKVLVLIPLIYLLPALLKDNVQAVFLAEPIADFIAVMTTAILFAVNFKKLMRQMRSQNSNAA